MKVIDLDNHMLLLPTHHVRETRPSAFGVTVVVLVFNVIRSAIVY